MVECCFGYCVLDAPCFMCLGTFYEECQDCWSVITDGKSDVSKGNEVSKVNNVSKGNEVSKVNNVSKVNEVSKVNQVSKVNEVSKVNDVEGSQSYNENGDNDVYKRMSRNVA